MAIMNRNSRVNSMRKKPFFPQNNNMGRLTREGMTIGQMGSEDFSSTDTILGQ